MDNDTTPMGNDECETRIAWEQPELRRIEAGEASVNPGNNADALSLS